MLIAPLAAGLALCGAAPQDTAGGAVRLLAHEDLSAAVAAVAAGSEVATVEVVGTSREGRAIEALRLTGPGEAAGRPGLLLIANLQGPRVFESGVALRQAERLAGGYSEDEAIRALLDSTVVWVVPRANPDPAESRFATPRRERWAGSTGVDDDRDGREGEDPPSDVNGDGLITHMRVLDPDGTWREDPTDERVLVEADRDKGEVGRWKLYTEGRDLDGDEEIAEDDVAEARVDKNFASGWEHHTAQAGLFPTDEPETRALCEFVMARPNLVLVLTYDGRDNLVEKPASVPDDAPPVKRVPKEGVLESDAKLIEEIGSRYRDATGSEAKSTDDDAGTFARWVYDHRGVLALETRLWFVMPVVENRRQNHQPGRSRAGQPAAPRPLYRACAGRGMTEDTVRRQYEAYPYPARDPAEEKDRLIIGSPSHPLEIDHYLFGGVRDWSQPFRALVAGGGTGDGLMMLAQVLADWNANAQIVYLDFSAASREIAEARAAARGLSNITFHTGDLLSAPDFGLFDYIDCCGVLHHLPDPDAGFQALSSALKPDGGLGAMVYAPYGRAGVYEMQAILRALTAGEKPEAKVAMARGLLEKLPPTNAFKRNPFLHDHLHGGDAGLYDLLLHDRDVPYDVDGVYDALERAGLAMVSFALPGRYDPRVLLVDPVLRERAAALSAREKGGLGRAPCGQYQDACVLCGARAGPPRAASPRRRRTPCRIC